MGALGADGSAPRFDCVVVGSGFGASVFAARLAARLGPGRLAVLERGPEVRPGEFPETPAAAAAQLRTSATPLGIFDLQFRRDLDSLVANVLGGGSQLYASVILEPLAQTFDIRRDPADPASPRAWPEGITAGTLRPYFNRVRGMLEVERWLDRDSAGSAGRPDPELAGSWAWGCEHGVDRHTGEPLRDPAGREVRHRPPLRRTASFDRAAAGIGAVAATVPLAVNLTRHHDRDNDFGVPRRACTGCGNCVTGCNVGAKNSLTANYLPAAVTAGAEIHTGVEVVYLRPSDQVGYRWALWARVHAPDGRTRFTVIHAKMVVLGAGVFGTGGILFRSRRRGLPVSALLGSRVSGNGDAIMLAPTCAPGFEHGLPGEVLDEAGPTITRMADFRGQAGRRHLVQDAAVPEALRAVVARLVAVGGWGRTGGGAPIDAALVMLAVGYDTSLGHLVERGGHVDVRWPAAGRDAVQLAARATTAAMAAVAGSPLLVNPRLGRANRGTPVTVHPLGGAPMGTGTDDGVVDDVGRLCHPGGGVVDGCYVADASVIPTSVGANPALTIAALAERAVETVIATDLARLLDGVAGTGPVSTHSVATGLLTTRSARAGAN